MYTEAEVSWSVFNIVLHCGNGDEQTISTYLRIIANYSRNFLLFAKLGNLGTRSPSGLTLLTITIFLHCAQDIINIIVLSVSPEDDPSPLVEKLNR